MEKRNVAMVAVTLLIHQAHGMDFEVPKFSLQDQYQGRDVTPNWRSQTHIQDEIDFLQRELGPDWEIGNFYEEEGVIEACTFDQYCVDIDLGRTDPEANEVFPAKY